MLNAKTIGERLRNLRGDIPMKAVAKSCNISLSALGMYETGKRIPRDNNKLKLAKYYNTNVETLFYID